MYTPNNWSFSGEVVGKFDKHVRQSVPLYDQFHDMIERFSIYYTEPGTKVLDIGSSTGTLLWKVYEANRHKPGTKFFGIDNEEDMIKYCHKTYPLSKKEKSQVQFIYNSIEEIDVSKNLSFAYSMLCLQFVLPSSRQGVLDTMYQTLNPGGAFVLVEKVKSDITDVHDIYNDTYYDFKRCQGLTDKEILDKNASLRGVMKPLTLEQNIDMLKKAGFNKIEVFMKYNNFAGIIAIK